MKTAFASLLLSLFALSSHAQRTMTWTVTLTSVEAGDLITVSKTVITPGYNFGNSRDGGQSRQGGKGQKTYMVRLLGIDAPEKGQPYYDEAKKALANLIGKNKIRLDIMGRNKQGVLFATVYINHSTNICYEMLNGGHAWWSKLYAPKDKLLQKAEARAREKKKGLWKADNPVAPWTYRRKKQ